MYDYKSISSRVGFSYWFVRQQGESQYFDVFDQEIDDNDTFVYTRIGRIPIELETKYDVQWDDSIKDIDSVNFKHIKVAFEDFKQRPEYSVGIPIDAEVIKKGGDGAAVIYEKILVGCLLLIYNDDSKALETAKKCLDWLRETDFFETAGSTRFHDAVEGGLLRHSLRVVNRVITLLALEQFSSVVLAEVILMALAHDWCKIGLYERYLRNDKNEETGVWSKIPSYRFKQSAYPYGHGVTSMVLAKKYLPMTEEMALACRWHMSGYSVATNESYDLSEANARFPMCLLLQWADQASITNYEGEQSIL